ncbi:MAG: zf-HC2 domain-containing protein [Anaerolineae bacterium]
MVELVTDYLENALPPDQRVRFEAHISTCQSCTNYLAQMRRTIQLTGKLSEESLSDSATKRLLATFRDWKDSDDKDSS